MNMLSAFTQMLGGLCGGDAPDWQIDQVIAWEDKIRWTAVCAGRTGAGPDAMEAGNGESSSLPTWRTSCWVILQALESQESAADQLRAGETRLAAELESQAALADSQGAPAEAARCREAAAGHRELARRHAQWQDAARDACAAGSDMLSGALPLHDRAAEGLAAAGGAAEVPGDKRWADDSRPAGRGHAA